MAGRVLPEGYGYDDELEGSGGDRVVPISFLSSLLSAVGVDMVRTQPTGTGTLP